MSTHTITVTVNGKSYQRDVDARLLLSDFLREDLELTGTHVGCEHGMCGACTVLFDDLPMRSCLILAVQADGHDIKTIEGVGTPEKLHPLQEAFHEKHALQCGFCTPGFIMSLLPFVESKTNPDREEIREAIDGNFCRCTGYENIIEAVKLAAQKMHKS